MSGPLAARFAAVGAALKAAGFPDGAPLLHALFVEGAVVDRDAARQALPAAAWQTLVVKDGPDGTRATGRIARDGDLLVWNGGGGGAPLPERTRGRWLAVEADPAVAARLAQAGASVLAMSERPAAGLDVKRTAMLSGLGGVEVWTGPTEDAPVHGGFNGVAGRIPFSELEILNPLLDIDAIAILEVAAAPAGAVEIAARLHEVFGERPWRGAWGEGGRLVLRADADPGWSRLRGDDWSAVEAALE